MISLVGMPRIEARPGEIAIDLHVHTLFSHCSITQPERIIRHAAAIGLGGVAVMDHQEIHGALDALRCCEDLKRRGLIPPDFLVIPGTEVNSDRGHIGALFVTESPPEKLAPRDCVKAIHDLGGLAVAVHPYHSTGTGESVFDVPFDAVETECGSVFNSELAARNRALVNNPRLEHIPKVGSSDAHYVKAIGSCYTILTAAGEDTANTRWTIEAVREAIITGRTEPRSTAHCERLRRVLGKVGKLD